MSFHIVADSCCELTADMKKRGNIEIAPLTLEVGGESILDDETFDQKYFLKRVAECPECPKSACPSPDYFRKSFLNGAERCYAVTLSAQLSGSYNSAVLGANLAQEENEDLKIHVFNSRSASIGETLIVKKIVECEEAGMSFERVVETVELYISTQHTYFVLENLETLRKNGRLSKTKALAGKFKNVVWSQTATNSFPAFLNSSVAIKLIIGHIIAIIIMEIASVITIGRSCGVTMQKANL